MKKLYFLLLPICFLFFTGCSKDFLKRYEDRVEGGSWELYDVNSFGIGGGTTLNVTSGRFTFLGGGQLEYRDNDGNLYQGTWDIRKEYYTDQTVRQLHIYAVDFTNQRVVSEVFDDMQFTGTNRFKAFIYANTRTYTFKFKR